jgi:hypothetical protein
MEKIQPIPTYIKKIATTADKCLQLTVVTQEVSAEIKAYLFECHDTYGHMIYFKNVPKIEDIEVPEGNAPEFGKKEKTPAQRLRGTLFVYWDQKGRPGEDFELFYRNKMDDIIEHFKGKLT